MVEIHNFKGLWPWPWIGSYCIPSCITHQPLPVYLHSKFHWNQRNFLWTEGRTYGRTDEHLRPTNVMRSTRRSRPNKVTKCPCTDWCCWLHDRRKSHHRNQQFPSSRLLECQFDCLQPTPPEKQEWCFVTPTRTYQTYRTTPPTFLIWNNLCDLVYQQPNRSYRSQTAVT